MKNYELIQLLRQYPVEMEVGVFKPGRKRIHKITNVYVGNEKYIPGGDKNKLDKIVIEYE